MAKKLPPIQHRFKPGVSGNPEGARRHNPIRKAMKKLTVDSFREILEAVCVGNFDHLKAIAASAKTPVLQVGVANALVKAANEGDYPTLKMIVEDITGKVPDEININAKVLSANVDVGQAGVNVREEVQAALAALKNNI